MELLKGPSTHQQRSVVLLLKGSSTNRLRSVVLFLKGSSTNRLTSVVLFLKGSSTNRLRSFVLFLKGSSNRLSSVVLLLKGPSEISHTVSVATINQQMDVSIMPWLCVDHMIQQGVWPMGLYPDPLAIQTHWQNSDPLVKSRTTGWDTK